MTARIDRPVFEAGTQRLLMGLGVLLVAVLTACASAPQGETSLEPVNMEISEVQIESGDDGTVVTLLGLQDPIFTAFRQESPARVVMDLSRVVPGEVAETMPVLDGVVEEVSLTAFESGAGQWSTRVELRLESWSDYEVVALEDRLEIYLTPEDLELAAVPAEQAWEAPVEDVTPSVPATQLVSASAERDGDGTLLMLHGDGTFEQIEHFLVEDPERLVIDLAGVTNQAGTSVDVGTEQVSKVRMGQHDGKVRVVLDAGEGASGFANAVLAPTADGLVVALGDVGLLEAAQLEGPAASETEVSESEVAAAAVPAAMDESAVVEADAAETDFAEETAAPMEEEVVSSHTAVHGVQFDAQPGMDRVVVLTDKPANYTIMTPDEDTLVLAVLDATISEEAAVRIAPEPKRGVSLVSAFQQPGQEDPEVRVVVLRAAGLVPEVTKEGQMIILDFPSTGDVAAGVPMLDEEEGAASAAADEAPPAAADPALAGLDAVDILAEGGLLEGKKYVGRRISLDFKDVEIEDVLRLIAEVSDLNIIAGDEVAGDVTIRLVDVPWDQALDVILLTKGLGFVRVGNVLRIAPSDTLKAEDESRLQERRAKEKLEDLLVKLQPVNYANVKEVSKMVNRLLTARGTVDVDERTNTIIMKDIASVIDEATALIKAIDTQTPQVLIEAKIVEAALDFSRELGATWAFGAQPLVDGFDESSGDRRDLGGNDFRLHDNALLSGISETLNHVSVSNPITAVPNGLVDLGAFILDERLNVELRIEAAESNGEGKVISSPRVVTLDNRKATILQGVSIPFQTFENGDAKLEFIDAVLKLDVTPHITADRSIIMNLKVQRNAPDDSVQTPTGSPAIARNEAKTETLVKDGQTLVIGGIYTVEKSERQSRVPYFHQIPILGNAFKNNEVRDKRKELLVFVTPRIVVNTELGS